AHLQIANLLLNGDTIGTISADAITHGRQLQLTARSSFPKAQFLLDGSVNLEGDFPGSATLKFTGLDVNPFLPAKVRGRVTHHAALDGQRELSGQFWQPHLLKGSLNIQQFSVEVDHVPIKSDGPVELSFANEI